jgi:hypothetical protein
MALFPWMSVKVPQFAGVPSRRSARPRAGWSVRRARRVALLAAALALVPAAVSYVGALLGRSNSGLGIRSVEWLRDHGASGLVSDVEDIYYTLTAPAKGGPALRALPQVGVAPGRPALAGPVSTRVRIHYYRPSRIPPVIHPALPGEGIWRPSLADPGPRPPVLVTTFRSEADYPRLVAGVAWIDMHAARVRYVPGALEPPVPIARGSADVPPSMRKDLVAAFNGGFKLHDAAEGFAFAGRTWTPLVPGIGTVLIYRDGRVDIASWHGGSQAPADVLLARQNLPLIVDNGRLNPNLSDGPEWGATVGNAIRVWRSGLGIDRRGNLIYAAANTQTVGSLAAILRRAGAVRALELDINEFWTSFITYRRPFAGGPANLLPDMVRPATRYLSPDDRDFFAVFARPRAHTYRTVLRPSRTVSHP